MKAELKKELIERLDDIHDKALGSMDSKFGTELNEILGDIVNKTIAMLELLEK